MRLGRLERQAERGRDHALIAPFVEGIEFQPIRILGLHLLPPTASITILNAPRFGRSRQLGPHVIIPKNRRRGEGLGRTKLILEPLRTIHC